MSNIGMLIFFAALGECGTPYPGYWRALIRRILQHLPPQPPQPLKGESQKKISIYQPNFLITAICGIVGGVTGGLLFYNSMPDMTAAGLAAFAGGRVLNDGVTILMSRMTKEEPPVGSSGSEDGCFIATACMGDYDHPMVMHLRVFRDEWLSKRSWGRNFIKQYYRYSPPVAKVIAQDSLLQKLCGMLVVKPLVFIARALLKSKNGAS